MGQGIIYRSSQKTYFIVIFGFVILAFFVLAELAFPSLFGGEPVSLTGGIWLLGFLFLVLGVLWCFLTLQLTVYQNKLTFGFGYFKKSFVFKDIVEVKVEDYKFSNYLGYGIRFGRDRSIAFVARGGRGVRLKFKKGRDYFFSCNEPEKAAQIIKRQIL